MTNDRDDDEHFIGATCVSEDLNIRVARLETELRETNEKLGSTEYRLSVVEQRCAVSEASCAELRRQIDAIVSTLAEYCKHRTSSDGSVLAESSVDAASTQLTNSPSGTEITDVKLPLSTTDSAVVADAGVNETVNSNIGSQWASDCSKTSSTVADCVKLAAESAVEETRFIFDPKTSMYYDCLSGYYYDAEKSLYYEPHSGMYFYYDADTQAYKYHSKIEEDRFKVLTHIIFKCDNSVIENGNTGDSRKLQFKWRKKHASQNTVKRTQSCDWPTKVISNTGEENSGYGSTIGTEEMDDVAMNDTGGEEEEVRDGVDEDGEMNVEQNVSELEDGELSTSSSDEEENEAVEAAAATAETVMQHFTPCIRAMVASSDCLTVGSLFIITCTGGTIGRDADLNHTVVIPDPQVSKMHCSIEYNEDRQRYVIKDHASSAGTFVNDKRLSMSKTISEPQVLYHGDQLRISATIFDLHIHPRVETCSQCEPGCVQQTVIAEHNVATCVTDVTKSQKDKEQERRRQLKKLKTKFGLGGMNYETHPSLRPSDSYQDRAERRRATVGSDGPAVDNTQPASVHQAISEQNVGHKLLSKMGWKAGESLGRTNEGILEPINVEMRVKASAGLGAYAGAHLSLDNVHGAAAAERRIKQQERYAKLSASEGRCVELGAASKQQLLVPSAATGGGAIKWVKGDEESEEGLAPSGS